ncbi:hypothetical protein [Pararhizobium sp.]|uniref:hypothetical protein n=1 Tax=Pararhizobium sp. TaxID=1977563 RepID=UPI003BAA326F
MNTALAETGGAEKMAAHSGATETAPDPWRSPEKPIFNMQILTWPSLARLFQADMQ